ncbi:hypothetical protein WR25_22383 [Diploscapter pachys]|uniref:Uncharacterized protein n=1 Tax=Diploscapter pachys TaxID=2018661 RepID=A0A2A2L4M8_9BILA|nr:hypothetical protein WR25_22383 [Diploscapter pachys]
MSIFQHVNCESKPPDAVVSDIELRCPEGWLRHGEKCFLVHHVDRSWSQALSFCSRYGAQLAKPETFSENRAVASLISRPSRPGEKHDYWLGLFSNEGSEDVTFLWSDGSPTSRYVGFWAEHEPNHLNGSCTLARLVKNDLVWRLSVCNALKPFVCERPACVKGSFFCSSGGCIDESRHCNGKIDCEDSSDELNCPASRGDTSCLQYSKGESGQIQSMNYPSSYRPNSNCRYVIEGPINSRIQLIFDFFETEPLTDILTVMDGGPAENSTIVLAHLSGSKSDKLSFTSSTNMMIIKFRSDASVQTRGFNAHWRAVPFSCGGQLTAQAYGQTLTSPGFPQNYPNGAECGWTIETNKGQPISLIIEEFSMAPDDYLWIYDGPSPASPVLARLSDNKTVHEVIISTSSSVYLYLQTDSARNFRGFSISYKRGCDIALRQSYGHVVSPGNLKIPYPHNVKCTFTVELPEGLEDQPITLERNRFDLGPDDYLKVFEGSTKGKALHEGDSGFGTGQKPPKQLHSRQGRAQLVFESNSVRNAMGFNFTYSLNCSPLKVPSLVTLSSKSTAYGAEITVACPPGYEFLNGAGRSFETRCQLGGKWSRQDISTCQPIYCSPVPQIPNGYAFYATNVSFGGVAKFSCYKGFTFPSGNSVEEIKCTADGRWTQPPVCKAATCPALPTFQNGERILDFGDGTGFETICSTQIKITNGRLSTPEIFRFGDIARVTCNPGYGLRGPEEVRCLSNQTLSQVPECVDIDECKNGMAKCRADSTSCHNIPGGYECKCLKGFESELSCRQSVPIPYETITASSHEGMLPTFSKHGWCAESGDIRQSITLHFLRPHIVDRIKFDKTMQGRSVLVQINYAENSTQPMKALTVNEEMNFRLGQAGEFLELPVTIEAQTIEIFIVHYVMGPCFKVEVHGCEKLSCKDINECMVENGFCEHTCINSVGGYSCACKEGYDLFTENGQGGKYISDSETGEDDKDLIRYNKSCVARSCKSLDAPENGRILTSAKDFRYPMVVQFQCNFAYQMMGPDFLQCLADATWNGTAPVCLPATCQGIKNNTNIGLLVSPENSTISYGQNISLSCTQQNRPARRSLLSSIRECIFDPQPDGRDYWLSGPQVDCPFVTCGPPPQMAGVVYNNDKGNYRVGGTVEFSCRKPYQLIGKSSFDDKVVRCQLDGTWDIGQLRCEGPVCVDPGFPHDGTIHLTSVEEGAIAEFSCNRPGFKPFPSPSLQCTLGAPCILSEDVGISNGAIPDGAFADNSNAPVVGYEPHKSRLSSTGWCGTKDQFIFLSVDLQRYYLL